LPETDTARQDEGFAFWAIFAQNGFLSCIAPACRQTGIPTDGADFADESLGKHSRSYLRSLIRAIRDARQARYARKSNPKKHRFISSSEYF
jgi:hypothetical protein